MTSPACAAKGISASLECKVVDSCFLGKESGAPGSSLLPFALCLMVFFCGPAALRLRVSAVLSLPGKQHELS